MALIICPECKKKILDTSNSCQSCGYSMEKFKMIEEGLENFRLLIRVR